MDKSEKKKELIARLEKIMEMSFPMFKNPEDYQDWPLPLKPRVAVQAGAEISKLLGLYEAEKREIDLGFNQEHERAKAIAAEVMAKNKG